jgi:hypothetical protein
MPRTVKWFIEAWDDLLVYLITLAGVLVAQYLPAFKSGQEISLATSWGRLIVASIIALSFVLKDEEVPQGIEKTVARAGKRRNLRRRLSSGLAQGMMWATLSGAVS